MPRDSILSTILSKTPWFTRGQRGLPLEIPEDVIGKHIQLIYNEAGQFSLVTHREERDINEARGVQTRWHTGVLTAALTSMRKYPRQFDEPVSLLIQRLLRHVSSLGELKDAHLKVLGFYNDTEVLLRASIWSLINMAIAPLEERVTAGLKAGAPDPEAMAAFEMIDKARQQTKDAQAEQKDDVGRAYARGQATEKERADKLEAHVRSMQAQIAQRDAQIQELIKAQAQAPSLSGGHAEPGRRQPPR